jgi:RHS repeat-associated protein
LRASGGASLGGYRYSAFGKTLEDTSLITQPLRWKGRWFSPVAGGTYDVRARQWSPELGVFLSVDEYWAHDPRSTLWGWGNQNPVRFSDPGGRFIFAPAGAGGAVVLGTGELFLSAAVTAYLAYLAYEALTKEQCTTGRRGGICRYVFTDGFTGACVYHCPNTGVRSVPNGGAMNDNGCSRTIPE